MKYSRIVGTGSVLPGQPVTNDDLVARGIDTSDAWIAERTGIRARHLAPEGVTSSQMGAEAARQALAAAGCEAASVDLIIVATSTPDKIFPSTACLIQAELGIVGGAAFDVQAVCSGFVYALTIADALIRAGDHKRALVIGAETFSRIVDWNDRRTCVLFGDGAGAVVLEASDEAGILSSAMHADGRQHTILEVPGNVRNGRIEGVPFVQMDGQAVFKFAVRALDDIAREVFTKAGLTLDQLDWFIPHQANIRILQSVAKRLSLPAEKVVVTVDRHGNTSAASVPLALDAAVRDGRVKPGNLVMLQGVGGGFTWGAVLLRM